MLCLMYIEIKVQFSILLLLIPCPNSHRPKLMVKEITQ